METTYLCGGMLTMDIPGGFYLGVNDVTFAPDGRVRSVVGKPILMEASRRQEAELQARVDAWRESFTEWAERAIGLNEVANDFKNPNCKDFPCFPGAFAAEYGLIVLKPAAGHG